MANPDTTQERPRADRGSRFVPRKFPRSYIPRIPVPGDVGLFRRSVRWLLPWTMRDYPGIERGTLEALGNRWTRWSVREYMRDRAPVSRRLAQVLREAIRVRVESGLALMAELDRIADQPPRAHVGFMRVDQVTGLSGRSDVGKRRAVRKV